MASRPRRLLATALLAVVALLAAGCSGTTGDTASGGAEATAASATASAARAMTEDDLVTALGAAGIGVYDSPAATTPRVPVTGAGPVRLLSWQTANLTRELAAGGGYLGHALDDLVPLPAGAPPFSFLASAYVATGRTAGAELSRRLMGVHDWSRAPDITFPDVVLLLLASDAATAARGNATATPPATATTPALARSGYGGGGGAAVVYADAPTGICSALSSWVSSVIASLFDALRVDAPGGGVTGFLADLWNAAVAFAQGVVTGVVATLTAPVLAVIKGALAVVGTLAMAASLLHPATVEITGAPDPVAFGVAPAAGNDATVTAIASTGAPSWPPDITDCAAQAGVPLPDPSSLQGSPVSWKTTGLPPLGAVVSKDATIGAQGRARLTFRTEVESQEQAEQGTERTDVVTVQVTSHRSDIKHLQDLLLTLLFNVLPGSVGTFVGGLLAQVTQPVFERLTALVAVVGSGSTTVVHHDLRPRTPTPSPTCSSAASGAVPDGTWSGPIATDVVGSGGKVSGSIRSTGGGQLTMTVAAGKVTAGRWTSSFTSSGTVRVPGGSGTIDSLSVVIGDGTVSGPATAPRLAGTGTVQGTITVSTDVLTTAVPVHETGPATATMTLVEADCDHVTATFVPSFEDATGGAAQFTGVASWTGTPQ